MLHTWIANRNEFYIPFLLLDEQSVTTNLIHHERCSREVIMCNDINNNKLFMSSLLLRWRHAVAYVVTLLLLLGHCYNGEYIESRIECPGDSWSLAVMEVHCGKKWGHYPLFGNFNYGLLPHTNDIIWTWCEQIILLLLQMWHDFCYGSNILINAPFHFINGSRMRWSLWYHYVPIINCMGSADRQIDRHSKQAGACLLLHANVSLLSLYREPPLFERSYVQG